MEWHQIVWAVVALVAVGAAWDIVRKLTARASLKAELHKEVSGVREYVSELRNRVDKHDDDLRELSTYLGPLARRVDALEEATKQQDKAMFAISNKIESRAAEVARTKWGR